MAVHRKKITFAWMATEEFKLLSSMPVILMTEWGFDVHRTIRYYDDPVLQVRIFEQDGH